uniref:Uncharacterized protein n=1 Tax=Romanomermis culicivorax TaxID=13658 RepID=A0A915K212_ROMCU
MLAHLSKNLRIIKKSSHSAVFYRKIQEGVLPCGSRKNTSLDLDFKSDFISATLSSKTALCKAYLADESTNPDIPDGLESTVKCGSNTKNKGLKIQKNWWWAYQHLGIEFEQVG